MGKNKRYCKDEKLSLAKIVLQVQPTGRDLQFQKNLMLGLEQNRNQFQMDMLRLKQELTKSKEKN